MDDEHEFSMPAFHEEICDDINTEFCKTRCSKMPVDESDMPANCILRCELGETCEVSVHGGWLCGHSGDDEGCEECISEWVSSMCVCHCGDIGSDECNECDDFPDCEILKEYGNG